MAAVDLLRMEPIVIPVRRFAGEPVVLSVAAAHQNQKSRIRAKTAGLGFSLEARLLLPPGANVAALGEFRADVVKVLLRFGLSDLLNHTLQIRKLFPPLCHEL